MLPVGGAKQGVLSALLCVNRQALCQELSAASTSASGLDGAWTSLRCATKKAGGSAKQGVGSHPKHLGMKMSAGELAFPGMIIVRQRGTKFHPGMNVGLGRDHTLFSTGVGIVRVSEQPGPAGRERRVVSVEPLTEALTAAARRADTGVEGAGSFEASQLAVQAELVQRRAQVKRAMLKGDVPLEPALFFKLPTQGGQLSWLERTEPLASGGR